MSWGPKEQEERRKSEEFQKLVGDTHDRLLKMSSSLFTVRELRYLLIDLPRQFSANRAMWQHEDLTELERLKENAARK